MGLLDIFRVGAIKREAKAAATELDRLRVRLGDAELMGLVAVRDATSAANSDLAALEAQVSAKRADLSAIESALSERRTNLVETDERLLLQEFGLYEPKYRLSTVAEYKARLDRVRASQSAMVKDGSACISATNWTLNGSQAEGRRMVRDYTKLIVRAFNTECDATVEGVKFFNIDASRTRIQKSFDVLNRLGARMSIQISPTFLRSKLDELDLAYEFQMKKQEEKEEQRQLREQAREEAKLQREIDAAREALAKEERHFRRALTAMEAKLAKPATDAERSLVEAEISMIRERIGEVEVKRRDVDYRAQNASAGYVYVISNVGAFGEGIFKIGVTRRLEPLDRIDELGDASVPFDFDLHALVFSDNAFGLENALHRHFAGARLNMVNGRKEFFRATIDQIESVLRTNFSKPVEITRFAEAAEYRQSIQLGAPKNEDDGGRRLPKTVPASPWR